LSPNTFIILIYIVLYIAALIIAVRQGETFPLMESLMVVLIVGFVFTGLVYLATIPIKVTPIAAKPSTAELVFTLGYLVLIAVLLVFKPAPKEDGNFWREKFLAIAFKLPLFVLIPFLIVHLVWNISWRDLGFSAGDIKGQLLASAVLILLFGGFNYFVGSAAAPLRKRQFSGGWIILGLGLSFLWNILETGLVEEFFFRAFLQTRLVNALGSPLAGICLASLLFGLAHAPGLYLRSGDKNGPLGEKPTLLNSVLYTIIVLSPAGWFTGLLYWRTQSLLAPVLVHAAVDAVAHTAEFIRAMKSTQQESLT
jgi:membrane protease YdiL (CAAX protease family)